MSRVPGDTRIPRAILQILGRFRPGRSSGLQTDIPGHYARLHHVLAVDLGQVTLGLNFIIYEMEVIILACFPDGAGRDLEYEHTL